MHILVVNDDGPPSSQSSPYVHSLVKTLQEAGHTVSVVLPHTQRSWIGKAHLIGHTVKPTYFRPGTLHKDDGTTHARPLPSGAAPQEEWILVDGTPASCVQIGLYHFFKDRGPIDLVVSGPNYGRNSTAVFALSSGTLGGAMEAAVCKKKAIALSYAFFTRNHDPEIIAGASNLSVKVIEYLYSNWSDEVDLYSVNVPLIEDVEQKKVLWTNMLQNYWTSGSCFQAVDDPEETADEVEQRIREAESPQQSTKPAFVGHHHQQFKWAPRFGDVYKSVDESSPGNDGWAVKEGYTSVTPLKANFMHAVAETQGEIKLPSVPDISSFSLATKSRPHFCAVIEYDDAYVQPLICNALQSRLPAGSFAMVKSIGDADENTPVLQIKAYEEIDFDHVMVHTKTSLANSYVIRKALIRKHYLSATVSNWVTKHPDSILAHHTKPSCHFELDYAEFLDDALVEAWELQTSFQHNEQKEPQDREWWILKPGMSDRGQGIRLFSTFEELQTIFEEWETDRPDSDDENDDDGASADQTKDVDDDGDYIITSHLRHFIAQPYIDPPLLFPDDPRKFHIRTYVLAVGSLKVYVYRQMLALFARDAYVPPSADSSLASLPAHLTNTCIQDSFPAASAAAAAPAVRAFWDLPATHPALPGDADLPARLFAQICTVTGETFVAAAREMSIHFQAIPNAFEVFGLDFLVDARGDVCLLEVNAFPDFRQTGADLRRVVAGFWDGVVDVAVRPFFGLPPAAAENGMVLVADVDLGKR